MNYTKRIFGTLSVYTKSLNWERSDKRNRDIPRGALRGELSRSE